MHSENAAPRPLRTVFVNPHVNWLWLAPFLAVMVWAMNALGHSHALAGKALLGASLTGALLGLGLGGQSVVLRSKAELTLAVRALYALIMGVWFGSWQLLALGAQGRADIVLTFLLSGGFFGVLMASFLKPVAPDAPELHYWAEKSVFDKGGWPAVAVWLWPVAVIVRLLAWGHFGDGSLAQVLLAVAILYLVMPPYRTLRIPAGARRAVSVLGRARVWAGYGLAAAIIGINFLG